MQLTNKYGLPTPIVEYAEYLSTFYDGPSQDNKNVISVTTLIKPLRQLLLRSHYNYVDQVKDVSDILATSNGTSIHQVFEEAMTSKGHTAEKRIIKPFMLENGVEYQISGSTDLIYNGQIIDLKTTSVYRYMSDDIEDYKLQLSMYRWLNGIDNHIGVILFAFTDWSSSKARSDSQYPRTRWSYKEIPLLNDTEVEQYIHDKLSKYDMYHSDSEEIPKLPPCSDEELWRTEEKYAVHKNNNKRAVKLFNSNKDAHDYILAHKDGNIMNIKHRPGQVKRCNYCDFTGICTQYDLLKANGLIQEF
jgi:hypothetical protein